MSSTPPIAPHGPRRPSVGLLLSHPAHFIALGAGSGLSPRAPGTVGTLWAWVTFSVLQGWWGLGSQADLRWAWLLGAGTLVGWWACTHTARSLRVADPSAVVWDEILAFWLILWLLMPATLLEQLMAFALFRYFDAAKPGPVGWADRLFKATPARTHEAAAGSMPARPAVGWAQGLGILLDDFVAAACTLLVMSLWVVWRQGGLAAGPLG